MKKIEIDLDEIASLNWNKVDGLIPAIIQDADTLQVLMLGYMNQEALLKSIESGIITFCSRTKKRLWVKGETSGNYLSLIKITQDCDKDALLVWVKPTGPVCHLNTTSCFGKEDAPGLGMLAKLEKIINKRFQERPQNSYVTNLLEKGVKRISQKVGEEGVEVALAGAEGVKEDIINESADLLFHLLILLKASDVSISLILTELRKRAG